MALEPASSYDRASRHTWMRGVGAWERCRMAAGDGRTGRRAGDVVGEQAAAVELQPGLLSLSLLLCEGGKGKKHEIRAVVGGREQNPSVSRVPGPCLASCRPFRFGRRGEDGKSEVSESHLRLPASACCAAKALVVSAGTCMYLQSLWAGASSGDNAWERVMWSPRLCRRTMRLPGRTMLNPM